MNPDESAGPSHSDLAGARAELEGFGGGEDVCVRPGEPRDPAPLIRELRAEIADLLAELDTYYAEFGPLPD